jgi:hypothetical protein
MKTEFEILRADRSTCNESEAKDMSGCLADGGVVVCYFPTGSAMRQASLFAAAPELLTALQGMMRQAAKDAEGYATIGNEPIWALIADASDAIAKAEGKA